jgi:FtsZ-binding cell division protein ZapB
MTEEEDMIFRLLIITLLGGVILSLTVTKDQNAVIQHLGDQVKILSDEVDILADQNNRFKIQVSSMEDSNRELKLEVEMLHRELGYYEWE